MSINWTDNGHQAAVLGPNASGDALTDNSRERVTCPLKLSPDYPTQGTVVPDPRQGSANTMELITLSIAGSALLIAGHWYSVVRDRFLASK